MPDPTDDRGLESPSSRSDGTPSGQERSGQGSAGRAPATAAPRQTWEESPPSPWRRPAKLLALAVLVAVVVYAVRRYDLERLVTYENIKAHLDVLREWAHRPYGPILFILLAWGFILLHMPELVVIVAGGTIYDFWEALIFSWIGCNAGISTAFLIARFFLRDYFKPILDNSFLAKYDKKLEENGLTIIIVLRLALFLFPPLTWAIGASGIKTRDYLIGSAIGVTPWLVAILVTLNTIQEAESMADLLHPKTLAVVGAFAVGIAVVMWVRKRYFSDTST